MSRRLLKSRQRPLKRRLVLYSIIFFILVLLLGICSKSNESNTASNNANNIETTSSITATDTSTQTDGVEQESILNEKDYKVLANTRNEVIENWHIQILKPSFNKEYLESFADEFKEKNCSMKCNINLYDNATTYKLNENTTLSDREYLKVADHFIYWLPFEEGVGGSYYPFQDFHYKELGGRNYKK